MTMVGFIFRTGPVIIPLILLVLLALGIAIPTIDYLRLRTRAKRQQKPLPGFGVLLREYSESDFLAYFLFASGLFLVLGSLLSLIGLHDMTISAGLLMLAMGSAGCAMIYIAQRMWKRFNRRVRGWRTRV